MESQQVYEEGDFSCFKCKRKLLSTNLKQIFICSDGFYCPSCFRSEPREWDAMEFDLLKDLGWVRVNMLKWDFKNMPSFTKPAVEKSLLADFLKGQKILKEIESEDK